MLEVLYEDNHILAVNKASGVPSQDDVSGDYSLLSQTKDWLKEKYQKPGNVFLGMLQRLDRPTSGVILFSKTSKALSRLNETLRNKELKKTYWAITTSCPANESGTLENYLERDRSRNRSYVVSHAGGTAKLAQLNYRVLCASDKYYLLEVELITGRHHQIRAQFNYINLSIRGDLKYGARLANEDASISLHARSLSFKHPIQKQKIDILAPPPNEQVWNFLTKTLN